MELIICGIVGFLIIVFLVILLLKIQSISKIQQEIVYQQNNSNNAVRQAIEEIVRKEVSSSRQETLMMTQDYIKTMSQNLMGILANSSAQNEQRDQALERTVTAQLTQLNTRFEALIAQNQQQSDSLRKTLEERLGLLSEENSRSLHQMRQTLETLREQSIQSNEQMRSTVQERLELIQKDNGQRLDQMRQTVDEKLQKTLDQRLTQSFELVNKQLEQVHKGLGEMQNLAIGVGDLKKVLSNVKTRGTLGEIQLGAILEQILSPEQYKQNAITRPGTRNPVEFAVVLPGDGEDSVLLPIDSKFPLDPYNRLIDAYETGSADSVTAAYKQLEQAIKLQAKTIRDKYIEVPYTTDFAIMFLPIEGLYAEVVRHGLVEILQREYKINIAGPTTMAALLNSLQMGFRTLAIQKRSSEVWSILGGVKTEFGKFSEVLEGAQAKIKRANDDLDKLIGTRTKAIIRRLRDVEQLEGDTDSIKLLIDSDQ